MSGYSTGAGLLSDRRPPFWRFAVSLYAANQVFRGLFDFAAIGGIVLLFMHPPSAYWLHIPHLGSASAPPPSTGSSPPPVPTSTVPQPAPSAATPDAKLVATSTRAPASGPSRTDPPAEQPRPGAASTGIAMPAIEDVRRPRMWARFL